MGSEPRDCIKQTAWGPTYTKHITWCFVRGFGALIRVQSPVGWYRRVASATNCCVS